MKRPEPDAGGVYGFNSDVSYRSRTYHVQTENMDDPASPTINSLVYSGGTLVRKFTSSYRDLPSGGDRERALADRVLRQHQSVLSRIKRGELMSG